MEYREIRFEVQNKIAILTLNRPDIRNAITEERMIGEIEQACAVANGDHGIQVLVITGADPAFSSGGNIKDMKTKQGMFAGSPAEIADGYRNGIQRIPLAICNLEMPSLAAVNGPAVGAGCDLALMCDMRVVSERATFAESFINVGLIPGDGGAYLLQRIVGVARAAEMTFLGETVDGATALSWGLANYCVPHEQLMEKTLELAGKIAKKPPIALRMSKNLLKMSRESNLEHILDQSASMQAICHSTRDHEEALDSIFEKRIPTYTGN